MMHISLIQEKLTLRLIFLRFILALLVVFLISRQKEQLAVFFFSLGAILSVLETVVQKKMGEVSSRRVILDAIADKFMVNIVSSTLALMHHLPLWVPLAFIARDVVTVIGAAIAAIRHRQTEFRPQIFSRMALFFQTILLLTAVIGNIDPILLLIAVAITCVSAIEVFVISEFRKIRARQKLKPYSLIGMITIADCVSLLNAIFGVMSILFAVNEEFGLSALMMVLAVVADFFDGRIAKWLKQQHEFGKEIDSLADTVSFGVAPAVFAFSLIGTNNLATISFIIFVFCGILRLARFNTLNNTGERQESFVGMPITANGVVVPAVFFFHMPIAYFPYLYLFLAFLMVSSLKVKKL